MPRKKKKIVRRSLIRKLPADNNLPWFVMAAAALFISVILFIAVSQLKAIGELKQVKAKSLQSAIAPQYQEKDMVRPTFLPTPTADPVKGPVKIPIIMYHYVEYVQDPRDTVRKSLNVTPNLFEAHLKSFQEANFESYFLKDVPDILAGKINYDPKKSVILTFDDGYEDFYTDVFPLLKKYHMQATLYVIYDFIGRSGFVTKDQVAELHESGLVEIGSHTFDHLYLKTVSDAVAEKQVIGSKKAFEETFHFKIYTFAYPYGAMSQTAIGDVKKAGYVAAVSVIPGAMQSEDNLLFLNRIRPGVFGYSAASSIEAYSK